MREIITLSVMILFSSNALAESTYYVRINKNLTKNAETVTAKEESNPSSGIPFEDWNYTNDSCSGFRQSPRESKIYYVRAKFTTYPNEELSIPAGYKWISQNEYLDIFIGSPKEQPYIYHAQCGYSSYPTIEDGVMQHQFFFNDTKESNVSAHAGYYEGYTMSNYKEENFAGLVLLKL